MDGATPQLAGASPFGLIAIGTLLAAIGTCWRLRSRNNWLPVLTGASTLALYWLYSHAWAKAWPVLLLAHVAAALYSLIETYRNQLPQRRGLRHGRLRILSVWLSTSSVAAVHLDQHQGLRLGIFLLVFVYVLTCEIPGYYYVRNHVRQLGADLWQLEALIAELFQTGAETVAQRLTEFIESELFDDCPDALKLALRKIHAALQAGRIPDDLKRDLYIRWVTSGRSAVESQPRYLLPFLYEVRMLTGVGILAALLLG